MGKARFRIEDLVDILLEKRAPKDPSRGERSFKGVEEALKKGKWKVVKANKTEAHY